MQKIFLYFKTISLYNWGAAFIPANEHIDMQNDELLKIIFKEMDLIQFHSHLSEENIVNYNHTYKDKSPNY